MLGFNSVKKFYYIAKDKLKKGYIKIKNALTKFFQKAIDMMKKVIDKLASKVRGVILGASHFLEKLVINIKKVRRIIHLKKNWVNGMKQLLLEKLD